MSESFLQSYLVNLLAWGEILMVIAFVYGVVRMLESVTFERIITIRLDKDGAEARSARPGELRDLRVVMFFTAFLSATLFFVSYATCSVESLPFAIGIGALGLYTARIRAEIMRANR